MSFENKNEYICNLNFNTKNTMSKFKQITTCDYINFVEATEKGKELMRNPKTQVMGFYIIFAINTGLRVGDIKKITFEQLRKAFEIEIRQNYLLKIREQKTDKYKEVGLNQDIKQAFLRLSVKHQEGFIFISQKNSVISTQHLNIKLKEIFTHLLLSHCISSHSLRKTFGRRVYDKNGQSEKALLKLSEVFNHSKISITKKYLGITKEEIEDIYFNL